MTQNPSKRLKWDQCKFCNTLGNSNFVELEIKRNLPKYVSLKHVRSNTKTFETHVKMEFTGKHSYIGAVSLKVGWFAKFLPSPGVPHHLLGNTHCHVWWGRYCLKAFCLSLLPRHATQPLHCPSCSGSTEHFLCSPVRSPLSQPWGFWYSPLLRGFWQGLLLSAAVWAGSLGDVLSGVLWPPQAPVWGPQCSTQKPVVAPWCFQVSSGTSGGLVAQIPFAWVCLLQRKAVPRGCWHVIV